MHLTPIKKYLKSSVKEPFYCFVSDGQYRPVLAGLSALGLDIVTMSGFCGNEDKVPDNDDLYSYIESADINANGKKFVVVGLGEYLSLRGSKEAEDVLSTMKNLNTGGAKAVLLIRGLSSLIPMLQDDPRIDRSRLYIIDDAVCDLTFTLSAPNVGLPALSGFRSILSALEDGRCGHITVSTSVSLENAILPVRMIDNAYEGVLLCINDFNFPQSCGSDDFWSLLLTELIESDGSLDDVFEKNGISCTVDTSFYSHIMTRNYRSWLYFICLKYNSYSLTNEYLQLVLKNTNRFEDLVNNVLDMIIDFQHTSERFETFYQERKQLIRDFPESDIANFVVNNRRIPAESVYKLSDTTLTEKEEIIAWVSRNGLIPEVKSIYPALSDYMGKFIFRCPELADQLTDYFERYKSQKLSNELEPDFIEMVDEIARGKRVFNHLPTRNEIIDEINKEDTYLYWLDALGVEYLAFIESLIQKRGLSMKVSIARAELPTITTLNKDFYDDWNGDKEKDKQLDETKHDDAGGYNFTSNELPIHLAKELDIISSVIDRAATKLALRQCQRFLLVSDHGASRLAVLRRKEEKYETDTKGERSGRCCKLFHPYELPFAVEENGYLVLADYGRFKGGRDANVEVHGGAALEEVVIPIIELTLKNQNVTVKMVDDVVTVDSREGTEISLFFNIPVKSVYVELNGKQYPGVTTDENHFSVKLAAVKRAGEYTADVYAEDDLVGKITLKAQGKSGAINDAFDDLF